MTPAEKFCGRVSSPRLASCDPAIETVRSARKSTGRSTFSCKALMSKASFSCGSESTVTGAIACPPARTSSALICSVDTTGFSNATSCLTSTLASPDGSVSTETSPAGEPLTRVVTVIWTRRCGFAALAGAGLARAGGGAALRRASLRQQREDRPVPRCRSGRACAVSLIRTRGAAVPGAARRQRGACKQDGCRNHGADTRASYLDGAFSS